MGQKQTNQAFDRNRINIPNQYREIINRISKNQIDINEKFVGRSLLHHCSQYKGLDLQIIRKFLDLKANPNLISGFIGTPLHEYCKKSGELEYIKLLIEYKGDINILNKDGKRKKREFSIYGNVHFFKII